MRSMTRRILYVALVALGLAAFSTGVAMAQGKKFPWQKPPGPIAGKWKATCPSSAGMVVEFSVSGDAKATGRIVEAGAATKYGYRAGEEIFRVAADDFGDWVGQLKWRSVAGAERWDPVRLTASPDRLDATMTTDDCYKNMPRTN